jgi:hypothetical protein
MRDSSQLYLTTVVAAQSWLYVHGVYTRGRVGNMQILLYYPPARHPTCPAADPSLSTTQKQTRGEFPLSTPRTQPRIIEPKTGRGESRTRHVIAPLPHSNRVLSPPLLICCRPDGAIYANQSKRQP